MDIQVLDCTLRDGGYINSWNFGERTIKGVIRCLEQAKIEIIECGFIRAEKYHLSSSVFSSMDQVSQIIYPKKKNVLYAIMIEQHNNVEKTIPKNDGNGADIIRLTFRKNEWNEARKSVKSLINKGYKVCVQPVGTASYNDESLLKLLEDVNQLNPYAFYLVDTLGIMFNDEMRHFFYLIDNNLNQDIRVGFHSHNNLQMSFSNAQELVRLTKKRKIIIDTSCYGMGRGAGNLATELLADYINNSVEQKYAIVPILNVVDKYLMPIYAEHRWGYDLPYFISAKVKCHPNYASYLIRKETLGIEKIEQLLYLIPHQNRDEYDQELIEALYMELQSCDIDDTAEQYDLRKKIGNRAVVMLGSGSSIISYKERIDKIIENCFTIAVNFVPKEYKIDALFISNAKRVETVEWDNGGLKNVLATSNLIGELEITHSRFFNYSALLGEGEASDNAGAMLIRLLKKIGVGKVYMAGFDGFDVNSLVNYAIPLYRKNMDYDFTVRKNKDISKQLQLALDGVEYEFITPTKYTI